MIKSNSIEHIGHLMMSETNMSPQFADFRNGVELTNRKSKSARPENTRQGKRIDSTREIVTDKIYLILPSQYIDGFSDPTIACSNTIVKQNFDCYFNACVIAGKTYSKVIDSTYNQFITSSKIKQKNYTNEEAALFDHNIIAVSNYHYADHIANHIEHPNNSIRLLSRYVNGSRIILSNLIGVANLPFGNGKKLKPFTLNDEIQFERNCVYDLFGQNIVNTIVLAHMNAKLGHSNLIKTYAGEWESSTSIFRHYTEQIPESHLNDIAPDGVNANVWIARRAFVSLYAYIYSSRAGLLTECNFAFMTERIKQLNPTDSNDFDIRNNAYKTAYSDMYDCYVQAFQLVSKLHENDKFVSDVSTDLADCLIEIA